VAAKNKANTRSDKIGSGESLSSKNPKSSKKPGNAY
jgi:hypothetical protein